MTYQVTVTEQVTDITTTDDVTSITITETPAIISEQVAGIQGVKGDTGQQGLKGDKGDTGPAGPGVATGGTTGQVLAKTSATDYATNWVTPNAGTVTSITATSPLTGGTITSSGSIGLDETALSLDGARITSGTINSARIPTLNQNTTGTASNITGTLGISQGGTGTAYGNVLVGQAILKTGRYKAANDTTKEAIFWNDAGTSALNLNVDADTTYFVEGVIRLTKPAMTLAGTAGFGLFYTSNGSTALTEQACAMNAVQLYITPTVTELSAAAANTSMDTTSVTGTFTYTMIYRGYIRTHATTAGKLNMFMVQSRAGSAVAVRTEANSYMNIYKVGSGSSSVFGNWS